MLLSVHGQATGLELTWSYYKRLHVAVNQTIMSKSGFKLDDNVSKGIWIGQKCWNPNLNQTARFNSQGLIAWAYILILNGLIFGMMKLLQRRLTALLAYKGNTAWLCKYQNTKNILWTDPINVPLLLLCYFATFFRKNCKIVLYQKLHKKAKFSEKIKKR